VITSKGRFRATYSDKSHWYSWHDFQQRPAADYAAATVRKWADESEYYLPHVAIIDSIASSGIADQFVVGIGSMDNLRFALEATEPGLRDPIVICGRAWTPASPGHVRIRHESFSGKVDDIERPASDAVRLFWRFAAEKFGVHVQSDPELAL
jgi:hypothetical protein